MNQTQPTRLMAVGGILAPAVFIGAWVWLGATRRGYSGVSEAISELARLGTKTHTAMSIAFVAFGVFIIIYSVAIRLWLGRSTAIATAVSGLATMALALAPLGTPTSDKFHFALAAIAYVAVVMAPLFGARHLDGAHAIGARALGAGIALALVISIIGPADVHGFFQRLGLTLGDTWFVITACALLRPHD